MNHSIVLKKQKNDLVLYLIVQKQKSNSIHLHKKNEFTINMNSFSKLRRPDSNERPLGYEPNELPLLHSAIFCGCKDTALFLQNK